jgi:sigma-E factor negative regulatory protein RseA
MTDKLHESLSALMDNEADELELRRVLKALEGQGEDVIALKAKWQRYHVVSASLKREIHVSPSCNLLASIQAELEQDAIPAKALVDFASGKSILRRFGQGAIAASVAVAVLFTADMVMMSDTGTSGNAAPSAQFADVSNDQLPGITGNLNPATATRVAVQNKLNPEDMSRLERMVSAELEDALEASDATFNPDKDN